MSLKQHLCQNWTPPPWKEVTALYLAVKSAGGVPNQAAGREGVRERETLCLFEAASNAVLQFVAADILEPVGQQNGDATEMYQI